MSLTLDLFIELNKFNNILFKDSEHSYYIEDKKAVSCTQFVSMFKKPFETDIIAERYAQKHGLYTWEVVAEWEDIKNKAATLGTHFHKYAELRYASKEYEISEEELPSWYKLAFEEFYRDTKSYLIPIKSEWIVGDEELLICGTLDQLFYNLLDKEFQIWDYKTSKEIARYSKYKNKMINGLSHLDECEYNTYSIQLQVYKKIIERNTGIKIGDCYICWVNPKNERIVNIKTRNMSEEVDRMFSIRLAA